MENYTNKIYARLNDNGIVIEIFSSVHEHPLDTDIFIEEGNEEFHAHVHLKYQVTDENGDYNYKYEDGNIVELTDEEKKSLFSPKAEPVVEPTETEKLIDTLILDNLNMQSQIDNLILASLE